jgi:hypothetical protein
VSVRNRVTALERHATTWKDGTVETDGVSQPTRLLQQYTGTWLTGASPAAVSPPVIALPYLNIDGFKTLYLEVIENNVGTATLNLEGSFDASHWYVVGYELVDNTASPARAVTALSVTQNTAHVYQLLDLYPLLRTRPSVNSGSLTVGLYGIPV